MTLSPLSVGVLGLGLAGEDIVRSLAGCDHVRVVAAADPRIEARSRFEQQYGGRGYETVGELCGDAAVEAIWIATPTHLHKDHVVQAAAMGKHLVVEKPFAATLLDADDMLRAASENRITLIAGGVRSFDPAFVAMRQLIVQQRLGPVLAVHSWANTSWMSRPRQPYELDVALGGGCVLNQAPHVIDVIRLMCGGIARTIRGRVAGATPTRPTPGFFSGSIDFVDGPSATFVYNGYGYLPGWEFVAWGETPSRRQRWERSLEIGRRRRSDSFDEAEARRLGRFGVATDASPMTPDPDWVPGDAGLVVVTCRDGEMRQSPHGLFLYDENGRQEHRWESPANARQAEAAELHAAVRRNERPVHNGSWGLATMEATSALLMSAESGSAIELERQVPVFD